MSCHTARIAADARAEREAAIAIHALVNATPRTVPMSVEDGRVMGFTRKYVRRKSKPYGVKTWGNSL